MVPRIGWIAGSVGLIASLTLTPGERPPPEQSSFLCYTSRERGRSGFMPPTELRMADELGGTAGVRVLTPAALCNPASVAGAGIAAPAEHLMCYRTVPTAPRAPTRLAVENRFGAVELEIGASTTFCVRSRASVRPRPQAGEFVALTYNVAGLPEGLSGARPLASMPIIGRLLNRYDLVLVQESWRTPIPNPLAPLRLYHEILEAGSSLPFRSRPASLPLWGDARRPSALVSDGLNVFSRFRFDAVVRHPWSECGPDAGDCLALKGFALARTALPGGAPLDVYNVHMDAGTTAADDRARERGIAELAAFIGGHSAGRAVIVAGDFNLRLDAEPARSQFARLLAATDLADACLTLGCPDPTRIDRFLFRSGGGVALAPLSWRLGGAAFAHPDGTPLSDHEPVEVRFRWEAR